MPYLRSSVRYGVAVFCLVRKKIVGHGGSPGANNKSLRDSNFFQSRSRFKQTRRTSLFLHLALRACHNIVGTCRDLSKPTNKPRQPRRDRTQAKAGCLVLRNPTENLSKYFADVPTKEDAVLAQVSVVWPVFA